MVLIGEDHVIYFVLLLLQIFFPSNVKIYIIKYTGVKSVSLVNCRAYLERQSPGFIGKMSSTSNTGRVNNATQ